MAFHFSAFTLGRPSLKVRPLPSSPAPSPPFTPDGSLTPFSVSSSSPTSTTTGSERRCLIGIERETFLQMPR
ncbi:hypothetical protein N2W54_000267 [Lotmaria passim]